MVSLVPSQFTNANDTLHNAHLRAYHLRLPDHLQAPTGSGTGSGYEHHRKSTPTPKAVIPEVYLTRLLATKGTVKKFIDDFFLFECF